MWMARSGLPGFPQGEAASATGVSRFEGSTHGRGDGRSAGGVSGEARHHAAKSWPITHRCLMFVIVVTVGVAMTVGMRVGYSSVGVAVGVDEIRSQQ